MDRHQHNGKQHICLSSYQMEFDYVESDPLVRSSCHSYKHVIPGWGKKKLGAKRVSLTPGFIFEDTSLPNGKGYTKIQLFLQVNWNEHFKSEIPSHIKYSCSSCNIICRL